ncbi:discoidin domain-containing receptor 2-like [Hetaerina americana]|uniref:discoidin domain-containing receptor 2-like n=1 Tax=Hetaerina americana TaxID=62018 RepID=UPI003A7F54AD
MMTSSKASGILFVTFIYLSSAYAVDTSQCITPLGMESGAIRDEDISASSSFDSGNVGPQNGRIRTESNGGAWCPKQQVTKEPKEWLEIDLHSVHVLTAAETQGRFGNGQGQEYAEAYLLEYWRPRLGKWVRYRDIKGEEVIQGNANTYLEAKRKLDPPVWANRVRFLPYSYHRRTVCMRVEIYGCYWNDGIVSYTMPQGDKRGSGWEFFDATYDGFWDGELLRRGLGQLTDGKIGPENFKMGYYDYERGQGWVGWRNDTRGAQPIEIKFEFDRIREFTAVHIFCNNQFTRDVQVFSEATVAFSIGGRHFPGEPITYTYIEDRIFENSRNISIKLHHRVGRFVKLTLHFAAKWIMISEVTFDSDVAHGNFSVESLPEPDTPVQSDVYVEKESNHAQEELPVSTARQEDQTYMAVIIGVLTAVILLLAVAIFLIVSRHRQRKCFASPLASKPPPPPSSETPPPPPADFVLMDDNYNQPRGSALTTATSSTPTLTRGTMGGVVVDLMDKLDDYQEPYQALKYAPYYSYSTVVMEMKDMLNKCSAPLSDTSYDYAVPELGNMPLLSSEATSGATTLPGSIPGDRESLFSKGSSSKNSRSADEPKGKKSPSQQEVLSALKRRLEQTAVPEFPRHRLRMLTKLADGSFGTVYVAEADGIPEYGGAASLGKRLVAVKFLLHNAAEKEKADFQREVRILAALEDPNIARVLGACAREEPLCVIMEYLDHGDLNQFLKTHVPAEGSAAKTLPPPTHHLAGVKTLSFNCLLYMAAQIASGMRYLETLNFVHRDLATRNCLVGKAYQIKISDFGTENEVYSGDYYKVDGKMAIPIRWMAWESIFLGKYTTKSDVWAYAVLLWEIFTLARRRPYEGLGDCQVVEHLHHLVENDAQFVPLPRPPNCSKDIADLMGECWRRNDVERPSFREIHLFLQRKNLGYAPI